MLPNFSLRRGCAANTLQSSLTKNTPRWTPWISTSVKAIHIPAADMLPCRQGTWPNPAEVFHMNSGGCQLLGVTLRVPWGHTSCLTPLQQGQGVSTQQYLVTSHTELRTARVISCHLHTHSIYLGQGHFLLLLSI